jgi:phosphodiesterase/alkaline phosphatase D-like protein
MRTYATMRKNKPDFFIHNGDNVYADGPIAAEQRMPDGRIWKNLTIEEKSKPAETLDEFRRAYKYNPLDGTFGPQPVYVKAPEKGRVNLPPSVGMQFFGNVAIDGAPRQTTVTLKDVADTALWSKTLDPAS